MSDSAHVECIIHTKLLLHQTRILALICLTRPNGTVLLSDPELALVLETHISTGARPVHSSPYHGN